MLDFLDRTRPFRLTLAHTAVLADITRAERDLPVRLRRLWTKPNATLEQRKAMLIEEWDALEAPTPTRRDTVLDASLREMSIPRAWPQRLAPVARSSTSFALISPRARLEPSPRAS